MMHSRLISVATALVMGVASTQAAFAGQAQANAIEAARNAYRQALETYAQTDLRARRAFVERRAAKARHKAQWLAYWGKRRAAEKNYADLLDDRTSELAAARGRITDAELAVLQASSEERSANDRLLGMLQALRDARAGSDRILSRNLEQRVEELRRAAHDAADASRTARNDLQASREAFAQLQQVFKARLDRARAAIPGKEELDAVEAAYSAALDAAPKAPTDETLDARALEQKSAGAAFLALMLQTPPPFVERVTVRRGDTVWYDAAYEINDAGSAEADRLGQQGYRNALSLVNAQIESADALIAQTERRLAAARERWEEASDMAGYHAVRIHLRNRDMLIFVLGVETTGVVLSAALTGGTAAPAVSALTNKLSQAGLKVPAQAIKQLPRRFWTGFDAGGLSEVATEAIQAGIGKHVSLQLAENPNVVPYVNDLNGVESTVVGDVVEMVAKDGASSIRELLTSRFTEGSVSPAAVTNVSIDAIASVYKAFGQSAVNTANSISEDIIFQETMTALLAQRSYHGLAAYRNALASERQRLVGMSHALHDLMAFGLLPRQRVISADVAVPADEAERIAETPISVVVTFSQPLEHAPKLTFDDAGVSVDKPEIGEAGPTVWEFSINRFDILAGAETIPMEISLSPAESPYAGLDSDPATPVRLERLDAYAWANYERGNDRNHAVRLKEEEDPFDAIDVPDAQAALPALPPTGCEHLEDKAGSLLGDTSLDRLSCEMEWWINNPAALELPPQIELSPETGVIQEVITKDFCGNEISSLETVGPGDPRYRNCVHTCPAGGECYWSNLDGSAPYTIPGGSAAAGPAPVGEEPAPLTAKPVERDLGGSGQAFEPPSGFSDDPFLGDADVTGLNQGGLPDLTGLPTTPAEREAAIGSRPSSPGVETQIALPAPLTGGTVLQPAPSGPGTAGEPAHAPQTGNRAAAADRATPTLPLGMDPHSRRTLGAGVPGANPLPPELGELEGTPFGDLVTRLGVESRIVKQLLKDGIQPGDQETARILLNGLK